MLCAAANFAETAQALWQVLSARSCAVKAHKAVHATDSICAVEQPVLWSPCHVAASLSNAGGV